MLVATLYSPPVPVMAMHVHCAPDVSSECISCLVGSMINATLGSPVAISVRRCRAEILIRKISDE